MRTIQCEECRGSGIFERAPDSDFSLECPCCDGEGTIDVPTTQEELDELGIPASASDLIDPDSSEPSFASL